MNPKSFVCECEKIILMFRNKNLITNNAQIVTMEGAAAFTELKGFLAGASPVAILLWSKNASKSGSDLVRVSGA